MGSWVFLLGWALGGSPLLPLLLCPWGPPAPAEASEEPPACQDPRGALPPSAALRSFCPGREEGDGGAPRGQPRRRLKRGFTYPGTLWCGAGDIAGDYEDLGEHRETDRCCRDHDHCQHVIYPFTAKYGYRNYRLHTISHCDCDLRLKACLRAVNDTASRVVGQAFFNIIQVPCFTFIYKEQCVEPYLYVWCKNYSTVAVAVTQDPVLYDYGGEVIDGPLTRQTTAAPLSTTTLRGTRFHPLITSGPPRRKPSRPAVEGGKVPGSPKKPDLLPKKPWKGKERKGKGKRPKGRKGKGLKKKKIVMETTSSPKKLAGHELGKSDMETPAGFPHLGEDSFNSILGDDLRGETSPRVVEDGAETGSKTASSRKGVSGPSSVGEPALKRKRRRRLPAERGQRETRHLGRTVNKPGMQDPKTVLQNISQPQSPTDPQFRPKGGTEGG